LAQRFFAEGIGITRVIRFILGIYVSHVDIYALKC
jgi:hypothetical protein